MCKCNGSLHPSTQLHTPITKPVRPVSPLSYPHRNQYTPFLPTNNTRICCYSNRLGWKFASIPVRQSFRKLSPAFPPGLSPSSFCSSTVCKNREIPPRWKNVFGLLSAMWTWPTPWTKTGLWILWGRSIPQVCIHSQSSNLLVGCVLMIASIHTTNL